MLKDSFSIVFSFVQTSRGFRLALQASRRLPAAEASCVVRGDELEVGVRGRGKGDGTRGRVRGDEGRRAGGEGKYDNVPYVLDVPAL